MLCEERKGEKVEKGEKGEKGAGQLQRKKRRGVDRDTGARIVTK